MLGTEQQAHVRLTSEMTRRESRRIQTQRQPCRMPGLEPAIENEHAIALAQPRQQPPGARRVGTGAVVIQNHVAIGIDAPGLQALDQRCRLGQRMTPGHAFDHFATEVALQIGKARPGNVPLGIAALPVIRVLEGKTTIENHQPRLFLAGIQCVGTDQLRNRHNGLL